MPLVPTGHQTRILFINRILNLQVLHIVCTYTLFHVRNCKALVLGCLAMPGFAESETAPLLPPEELAYHTNDQSLWQIVIQYRKSMLWCTFFALSALLWGYDNQVISTRR